ncbi:hypothetical protein CPC08DRAFT_767621 [Agrocybe pediades]|nr:hypothetical protein CPC08DRAFT_767621 [Agrocybe pediades]
MPAIFNTNKQFFPHKDYPQPVPRLFTSNIPPTEQEFVIVREAINNAGKKKEALERRINDANFSNSFFFSRYRLNRSQRRLQAIDKFIATHKARISPCGVLRLPPELLSIIFDFVANQSPGPFQWDEDVSPVKHLLGQAFTLSHVCQSWNAVAVSMPRLWQFIPFVELSKAQWMNERHLQCFREVLMRGKDLPIAVMLSVSIVDDSRARGRSSHPAVKLLVQHSERWDSLDISMPNASDIMPQLAPIKGKLSSLKSLRLSFEENPRGSLQGCSMFQVAPKLQCVTLENVTFDLPLPTHKDLDMKVGGNATVVFGDSPFLSLCSSLIVHLQLRFNNDSGHIISPICLPNLSSMKIGFQGCPSAWFLETVTVGPSLRQLDLSTKLDEDLTIGADALISRSQAHNLKILSIRQRLTPGNLLPILNYTNNLLRLHVPLPDLRCIIALCQVVPAYLPLVPLLKTCEFTINKSIPANAMLLLRSLAEIRCDYFKELRSQPGLSEGSIFHHLGLASLEIFCSSKQIQQTTLRRLNGWEDPQVLPADFEKAVARVKQKLERLNERLWLQTKWEKFTKADLKEMESDLQEIYAHDGLTVSDLMATDLPKVVKAVKQEVDVFDFRDLAALILEKWDPILHPANAAHWGTSSCLGVHYGESKEPIPSELLANFVQLVTIR